MRGTRPSSATSVGPDCGNPYLKRAAAWVDNAEARFALSEKRRLAVLESVRAREEEMRREVLKERLARDYVVSQWRLREARAREEVRRWRVRTSEAEREVEEMRKIVEDEREKRKKDLDAICEELVDTRKRLEEAVRDAVKKTTSPSSKDRGDVPPSQGRRALGTPKKGISTGANHLRRKPVSAEHKEDLLRDETVVPAVPPSTDESSTDSLNSGFMEKLPFEVQRIPRSPLKSRKLRPRGANINYQDATSPGFNLTPLVPRDKNAIRKNKKIVDTSDPRNT